MSGLALLCLFLCLRKNCGAASCENSFVLVVVVVLGCFFFYSKHRWHPGL